MRKINGTGPDGSATSRLNMKGLVLSGGKGSRLRPFTYSNAKQLVPIANKPVLFYAIEHLVDCGITDIGVVVGDTAPQITAAVGDGSRFGARITYIQQEQPLGIAHAVKIARPFLADEPFVLFLGDNFILGGIAPFVETFRRDSANCQVLLHRVPNPQAFGIAEMMNGHIARVVEKPPNPPSDLAVIGIYMFDHHVFEAVDSLRPSARGELEITDTIQYLIDKGLQMEAQVLSDYWIDTGKMDDILDANRAVLERLAPRCEGDLDQGSRVCGRVVIERGARLVNSVVRGPAIIGQETQLVDARIGPFTSVSHHCLIQSTHIANSVVMEHTTVQGIAWPIEGSLVGRHVQLQGNGLQSRIYTLTLGDHSQVHLV